MRLISLLFTAGLVEELIVSANCCTSDRQRSSSDEDQVEALPGLISPINFRHFSGYLKVSDEVLFHYWFIESQSRPDSDPLVLWLNGGPGCSSLGGLFMEVGPFRVEQDGKTVKLNEHSWNRKANIIFLDTPAKTGFSYSKNKYEFTDDDSVTEQNLMALKVFFKKFPHFRKNQFYLVGESYAAVFVSTLSALIDRDPEFNLRGVAIGNGFLQENINSDSMILYAYHHGLFGSKIWNQISILCCDGSEPSRENCN